MKRRKRACGCESHAIPSVIQCAVYLSQREVDTLEKGDKVGNQSLPALFFMPAKTNSLKVRRIDLLEQLNERFETMTDKKLKYDRAVERYELACEKYKNDVEVWEAKIPIFLDKAVRDAKIEYGHRREHWGSRYTYNYSSDESWSASMSVSFTRTELERRIGPMPEKPEYPSEPAFLRERGTYRQTSQPSLYQAVYQAIQLLLISDDEYVNASTYQMALEVL